MVGVGYTFEELTIGRLSHSAMSYYESLILF